MNTCEVSIRRVRQGDARTLAYISTESWKAAFADILPADLLASLTEISKVENMYAGLLDGNVGNGYILETDGTAHCIAYWDNTRESDMTGYAELICIHSLQDKWHMGYGSIMMEKVLHDICSAGYEKVMLWVFKDNKRAVSFYEKHGFSANGKSKEAMGTEEIMFEKALK